MSDSKAEAKTEVPDPPKASVVRQADSAATPKQEGKRYELTYARNSKYELTIEGKIVAVFFCGEVKILPASVVEHHEFALQREHFSVREVE